MLWSATLTMGRHFLSPLEKIKNTWLGCWGEVCMPSPCRQIFLYLPDWQLLNSNCVNYWNYQTILTTVFKVHNPFSYYGIILSHLPPLHQMLLPGERQQGEHWGRWWGEGGAGCPGRSRAESQWCWGSGRRPSGGSLGCWSCQGPGPLGGKEIGKVPQEGNGHGSGKTKVELGSFAANYQLDKMVNCDVSFI